MKYENNPAAMKSLRDWKSVDQWAAVNGGGGGGVGASVILPLTQRTRNAAHATRTARKTLYTLIAGIF